MRDRENDRQRKIGVALSYANIAFTVLFTAIYTPIMLRYLGSSEYGVYTMASSLIGYLAMLDLGMGSTLTRFSARYRAQGDTEKEAVLRGAFLVIYTILGLISLICGLLLYWNLDALFGLKFTAYELSRLKVVFLIMTVNLALSFPLGVFTSVATSYERFALEKGVELLKTVLTYGTMLVLLFLGGKSVSLSLATAVISLLMKGLMLWYCFSRLRVKIRLGRLDQGAVREIVKYSFFIFLNVVVDQLYQNTDEVILGAFCGTLAVTTYHLAIQFHALIRRLSTAVSGVYLPHITALVAKSEDGGGALSELFVSVGRFQFILLSFAMSGFICFGIPFIDLWAGAQYRAAYYMALIIMIPALIPLSQNIGISILQAENRHGFRSVVYLILALLNVAVSIPLAIRWEGVGAAIGTAISCILGEIVIMNIFYARKIGLNIGRLWREIAGITLPSAAMCALGVGVGQWFEIKSWLSLAVAAVLYSAVYAAVAWRFILNKEDKSRTVALLKRLKR